jgi:hypothetical protein
MSADVDYAKALTGSMMADMARTPTLDRAIVAKQIGPAQLTQIIKRDLERELRGERGIPLFPNLRAFAKTQVQLDQRLPVGLEQDWGALIGAIVPAIAKVATGYVVARTEAGAATTISKYQLQAQALQIRSMDLTAATQRANEAAAAGVPGGAAPMPGGTLSPQAAAESGQESLPAWVAPVGIGVAVLGVGYIAYKAFVG